MVLGNKVSADVSRRAYASNKEAYSRFLHSVYNESKLFDTSVCSDLHSYNFKYTFFLS